MIIDFFAIPEGQFITVIENIKCAILRIKWALQTIRVEHARRKATLLVTFFDTVQASISQSLAAMHGLASSAPKHLFSFFMLGLVLSSTRLPFFPLAVGSSGFSQKHT